MICKRNNDISPCSQKITIDKSKVGLCLFRDTQKVREVENVPSIEAFNVEINRIVESKPHGLIYPARLCNIAFASERDREKRNRLAILDGLLNLNSKHLKRKKILASLFYCNVSVIKPFLTRGEVEVNKFGVPLYGEGEVLLYNYLVDCVPFRSFQHKEWETECLFDPTFNPIDDDSDSLSVKKYNNFAVANGFVSPTDRWSFPSHNAFNFVGTIHGEVLLQKNKKRFDIQKLESNSLKGIHYVDEYNLDYSGIVKLIESVQSKTLLLDDVSRNVFILNFGVEEGHVTCGILVFDSSNTDIRPVELFVFDSESSRLNVDFVIKKFEDLNAGICQIKVTYIFYNAQIENSKEVYDFDMNCFFYSIRTMNALVEILSSSNKSPLSSRILDDIKSCSPNGEEDIANYANDLATHLPDYFDYDSASKAYHVKDFEDRKILHIGDRWYLGRMFLKKLLSSML